MEWPWRPPRRGSGSGPMGPGASPRRALEPVEQARGSRAIEPRTSWAVPATLVEWPRGSRRPGSAPAGMAPRISSTRSWTSRDGSGSLAGEVPGLAGWLRLPAGRVVVPRGQRLRALWTRLESLVDEGPGPPGPASRASWTRLSSLVNQPPEPRRRPGQATWQAARLQAQVGPGCRCSHRCPPLDSSCSPPLQSRRMRLEQKFTWRP